MSSSNAGQETVLTMSARADPTQSPNPQLYSSAVSAKDHESTARRSFVLDPESPQSRRRSASHTLPDENTAEKAGKPATGRKRQKLSNPIGQYIINVILQMAAIVAAVTFGYFAVRSVRISERAYNEAYLSNQIAIYAVCNMNDSPVSIFAYLWMLSHQHNIPSCC